MLFQEPYAALEKTMSEIGIKRQAVSGGAMLVAVCEVSPEIFNSNLK
jgi:hypothetical protein